MVAVIAMVVGLMVMAHHSLHRMAASLPSMTVGLVAMIAAMIETAIEEIMIGTVTVTVVTVIVLVIAVTMIAVTAGPGHVVAVAPVQVEGQAEIGEAIGNARNAGRTTSPVAMSVSNAMRRSLKTR